MRLIPILLLLFINSHGQNSYTIQGYIKNSSGKKVLLSNSWGLNARNKAIKVDTALSTNDSFSFTGTFDEMMYYSLSIENTKGFRPFIIDTGNMRFEGDIDNLKKIRIANSQQNKWMSEAGIVVDSIHKKRARLQDSMIKYLDKDEKQLAKFSALRDAVDIEMEEFLYAFTKQHPDSYFSFNILNEEYNFSPKTKELAKRTFPLFSDRIKKSREGKYMQSYLFEDLETLGKSYPIVSSYDLNKKRTQINLDINTIYVIDYWASWCVPCIKKLPELKSIYNQYKGKNFKVISISLDNNFVKWKKSVQANQITWSNYCSLNGFEADEAKKYNIQEIPYTILIGKGNKIIKMNPTEDEIRDYLNNQ